MTDVPEQRLDAIERKLDLVVQSQDTLAERVGEAAAAHKEWRERTARVIYGDNGSTPGLLVRLDRLEQDHERSRWLTRAVVGAVVTLLVGGLWALLR